MDMASGLRVRLRTVAACDAVKLGSYRGLSAGTVLASGLLAGLLGAEPAFAACSTSTPAGGATTFTCAADTATTNTTNTNANNPSTSDRVQNLPNDIVGTVNTGVNVTANGLEIQAAAGRSILFVNNGSVATTNAAGILLQGRGGTITYNGTGNASSTDPNSVIFPGVFIIADQGSPVNVGSAATPVTGTFNAAVPFAIGSPSRAEVAGNVTAFFRGGTFIPFLASGNATSFGIAAATTSGPGNISLTTTGQSVIAPAGGPFSAFFVQAGTGSLSLSTDAQMGAAGAPVNIGVDASVVRTTGGSTSVALTDGGSIFATQFGIRAADAGTGAVSVSTAASSRIAMTAGTGIDARSTNAGGAVTLDLGGTITGAASGVVARTINGPLNVTVNAGASVTGTAFGLDLATTGTGKIDVVEFGTVAATDAAGTAIRLGAAGSRLTLGTASSLTGTVLGSGSDTLQLGGTGSGTFDSGRLGAAQQFRGFTAFNKVGDSTWTLGGSNAAVLPWTVQQGTLVVDGSLPASLFNVTGGTLGGVGTIGGLSVATGATVAPGVATPFSRLTVNGNLRFAPDSFFNVAINTAGQSDRIDATGAATLDGGTVRVTGGAAAFGAASSSLRVTRDAGGVGVLQRIVTPLPTRFTILHADGGVTGAFAGVTTDIPSATASLSQDAMNVFLNVTLPPSAGGSVVLTPNEFAAGQAAFALPAGNAVFAALQNLTVAQGPQAFDALSGEIHASEVTAAIEGSRLIRDAIMGRLWQGLGGMAPPQTVFAAPAADLGARSPAPVPVAVPTFDPKVFALWGQAFGSWGHTRGDRNAARLDRDTGGFIIGADATFDGVTRIGIAAGFQRTRLDVSARRSSGETDSVFAALYGGTALGPLNLRLGASFAGQQTDIRRDIVFPGFFDSTRVSYDGYTAQAFGELGYRFSFLSSIVEPFIGATALTVHRDGFAEAGGAAALVGFARDHEVGFTTVGLRTEWRPFDAPIVIRGMTGWRHAFGDVTPSALLAFRSAVGTPFAVGGVPLDRNVLVGETAVDWRMSDSVTLSVAYTGQLARRATDNGVKGQFLVRF